ncbi:MAG: hypothetical protein ACTSU4_13345 [Promethearchaeota archaeon]
MSLTEQMCNLKSIRIEMCFNVRNRFFIFYFPLVVGPFEDIISEEQL